MTKALYLSRNDVEKVGLPMEEIIENIEWMFREKGEGRLEAPPKPAIHPCKDSFVNAMLAYLPSMNTAGLKWISTFPENPRKGLPCIAGLLILNDPETGIPRCIMDCTWITAKRTGAATAVAAKYLARKNSEIVAVLGCGIQGYGNLEALDYLFPIRLVKAFDIMEGKARDYAERVNEYLGLKVKVVQSAEEAVRESDLIVTAGPTRKNPNPIIEDAWMEPGAFAAPVDYDSYWKPEALLHMDKFYTDDVAQMMYHKRLGYFQNLPERVLDLGDLVTGRSPGRVTDTERTMSMNLGLAGEDISTATLIWQRAKEKGIGIPLEL